MANKMTPEDIVKNFLPNYSALLENTFSTISQRAYMQRRWAEEDFVKKHFPEALAELLQEQKQTCYEHLADNCHIGDGAYSAVKDSILNAPTPEPKNKTVEYECTNTNPYGLKEYRDGCKQNCEDCDYNQPIKK